MSRVNAFATADMFQWNNQNTAPWQKQIVEGLVKQGKSPADAWAELNRQMESGMQPAMLGRDGQPMVVSNMPVGLWDSQNPTGIAITSNPQLNGPMQPSANPYGLYYGDERGIGAQRNPKPAQQPMQGGYNPYAQQDTAQGMMRPYPQTPTAVMPQQTGATRNDVRDPRLAAAMGQTSGTTSMRDLIQSAYGRPAGAAIRMAAPQPAPQPMPQQPPASAGWGPSVVTDWRPPTREAPQQQPTNAPSPEQMADWRSQWQTAMAEGRPPPPRPVAGRAAVQPTPTALQSETWAAAQTGSTGWQPGTDPVSYLQRQTDRANAANEGRYQQLLGNNERDLQSLRDTLKGEYDRMAGLVNTGQQANLQREGQLRDSELGNMQQSLLSRGLGNTTVRDTMRAGIMDQSALRQREIADAANNQRLGLYGNYANTLLPLMQGQYNQRQGIIEGRVDQGPNSSLLMQLLSQPRAETTQPGTNTAVAGSNPYTMAAQGNYPNPYMQAMQQAQQPTRQLRPGDGVPITGGPVGTGVRMNIGPQRLGEAQGYAQAAFGGRQQQYQNALGGMYAGESAGQGFSYNQRGKNAPSFTARQNNQRNQRYVPASASNGYSFTYRG